MRLKSRFLQASTIFPPILALLVSLSLFLSMRREDTASRDFRAAENMLNRALDLDTAVLLHLRKNTAETGLQWETAYKELVSAAAYCKANGMGDRDIVESIEDNCMAIAAKPKPADANGNGDKQATDTLSRLRQILAASFRLAERAHSTASESGQATNVLIIVFSSILAVVMAVAAYLAAKEEIAEREKMGDALRQSDIRLSDAVVKLKRAHEQAIRNEHLHALEQAARETVHEGRNVLTPILSTSDMLMGNRKIVEDKIKLDNCLMLMGGAAKRLEESFDHLSRFLHPGTAFDREPVDLNKVVQTAGLSAKIILKDCLAHITVETDLQDNLPQVEGDESDLCELTMNLVRNAIDAMSTNGGKLSIRTLSEAGWAAIEVKDTGAGMTDEVRRRCMEPFFSTKGSDAAGMGLAVVESIVRQHHGTIDVESKPGEGTTFVVCLPVKPSHDNLAEGTDFLKRIPQLRILVVDDESWSRLALAQMLMTEGHMAETAANGREGLKKFQDGLFDLVITDRAMPDTSGEEFAAQIRKLSPEKPVILVSGFSETIDLNSPQGRHICATVTKPVRQVDLHRALIRVFLKEQKPAAPERPSHA